MKVAGITAAVVVVSLAGLGLLQLWIEPFSAELFLKLALTLVVVLMAVVAVALIHREYLHERRLRHDKFIN